MMLTNLEQYSDFICIIENCDYLAENLENVVFYFF